MVYRENLLRLSVDSACHSFASSWAHTHTHTTQVRVSGISLDLCSVHLSPVSARLSPMAAVNHFKEGKLWSVLSKDVISICLFP